MVESSVYYKFDFEWPSLAAKSVYVTGNFDNWSKSIQLLRDTDKKIFTTTVKFTTKEKIIFKYVVDNDWCINSKLRSERDASGFENNVLLPEDLKKLSIEDISEDFEFNNDYVNGKSDTETESSAFTSVSYPSNEENFAEFADTSDFDDNFDEDLSNSTQLTLNGDSSNNTSISLSNSRNNSFKNSSFKNKANVANPENTTDSPRPSYDKYNARSAMISRFKNLFKSE